MPKDSPAEAVQLPDRVVDRVVAFLRGMAEEERDD